MHWDVAACTDKGLVRSINEDSYRISQEQNLFVLADGLGGAAKGEVASAIAVDAVISALSSNRDSSAPFSPLPPEFSNFMNLLVGAIQLANHKIHDQGMHDPSCHGMGATIVAAGINGRRLTVAHVGDSRAYLLRANSLEQLTADHSLVAEQVRRGLITRQQAATSELQSVLTRALGMEADVQIDADEMELLPHDSLLLCSDGLTRMVAEQEIAAILEQAPDARTAADQLVKRANECGGADNVTVIVVRNIGVSPHWLAKVFPWFCSNVF
jgi:serine/threonine protein phosphatase PrpC